MGRAAQVLLVTLVLTACNREKRIGEVSPAVASVVRRTRELNLQPGTTLPEVQVKNPYEGNYDAMNQGKRLFSWYNCAGCHSSGGGGAIGPPLIDANWIYGNQPINIYETILKGRPNGMPAFGGKIPEYQVWQLVTYVRSMSPESMKKVSKKQ